MRWGFGVVAVAVVVLVIRRVDATVIQVVAAKELLPRWDLASHLLSGWMDFGYARRLRLDLLVWDVWSQGYWPPGLSLWQVPAYAVLGADLSSGLRSSLLAFGLLAAAGPLILRRVSPGGAVLPGSIYLWLLLTSPLFLAYASLAMTEILGALLQAVVLLTYLHYRHTPTPVLAKLFALSLTGLFFTKYNYFLMVAVPLGLYEYLRRTEGTPVAARFKALQDFVRWAWSTPSGKVVVSYAIALGILTVTGGIEFSVLGQRVSVQGIGASGHVVLYFLLARVWWRHRRGRINWQRLRSADPLVRPLTLLCGVPVVIWLAFPYPNHLRDIWAFVMNRPMNALESGSVLEGYVLAFRDLYFVDVAAGGLATGVFVIALLRYHIQTAPMRVLLLMVVVQLGALVVHQTVAPRFLSLTLIPFWLVVSAESGRWIARLAPGGGQVVSVLLACALVLHGGFIAGSLMDDPRFRRLAFQHFVDNPELRAGLSWVRTEVRRDGGSLTFLGRSDELSPGLLQWTLGPPSGGATLPVEASGRTREALEWATHALLIVPTDAQAPSEILERFDEYSARLQTHVADDGYRLVGSTPVTSLHVELALYRR